MTERRCDVWTRTPPVVDGMYWFRKSPANRLQVVRVDGGNALSHWQRHPYPLGLWDGEWQGPLVPNDATEEP